MSELWDFLLTAPIEEVIDYLDAALELDRKMGRTICSQCHGMRIERWSALTPIDQPRPLLPTHEERPCRKCNGSGYNS